MTRNDDIDIEWAQRNQRPPNTHSLILVVAFSGAVAVAACLFYFRVLRFWIHVISKFECRLPNGLPVMLEVSDRSFRIYKRTACVWGELVEEIGLSKIKSFDRGKDEHSNEIFRFKVNGKNRDLFMAPEDSKALFEYLVRFANKAC